MGNLDNAINSLPRSVVLAIQFIAAGVFLGIWWSGNQAQINEIKNVKESVDKMRGEMSSTYTGRRDFRDLQSQINWRLRMIYNRYHMEYVPISIGEGDR